MFVILFAGALGMAAASQALGQSFGDIQGKWTLKKATGRFSDATQTIVFKDSKFTYLVVSKAGDTLQFAKGRALVDKLGPFSIIKLTEIAGGDSADTLNPTGDDRTLIYMKGYDTLIVAANFDASRDGEETGADTWTKVKP